MLLVPSVRTLTYGSPVNWAAPLNRGLTGWWKVLPRRTGGGQWFDLTRGLAGTLTGMGATSATSGWGATTRPGGAGELRFDGTNDYVVAPGAALPNLAPGLTIAVWVKQRVLNTSAGILQKNLDSTHNLTIETWSDGFLYFDFQTGVSTFFTYAPFVAANQWFHLVCVYDGAGGTNALQMQVYLNGVAMTLGTSGTLKPTLPDMGAAPVNIGRYGTAQYWNGMLDDVRLVQRAYTPSEVDALYTASRTGYQQELTWQTWPPPLSAGVAPPSGTAPPPLRHPWRFFRRAA